MKFVRGEIVIDVAGLKMTFGVDAAADLDGEPPAIADFMREFVAQQILKFIAEANGRDCLTLHQRTIETEIPTP